MQPQTNEEHCATTNKWSTLGNCKQMNHIMQLRTNEAHYAPAKNEEYYATANE